MYLSIHVLMVKVHFTLSCTVAAYFCLHTGGILLSQDTESVLCFHVVDVHDVFYINNFKNISYALFSVFNSGLGIAFYSHLYF
jgi:hypothetical protein